MCPMDPSGGPRQGTVYVASRLVVEPGTVLSPGAVAVADGAVILAGPPGDVLRAAPPGSTKMEFPGSVLLPGLVNAHVHLQIPRFVDPEGRPLLVPPSFIDWILQVISWRRGADPSTFPGNLAEAARETLSFGVTAVGEITGPDLSAYENCPLRARVYAEGVGFAPEAAAGGLAAVTEAVRRLEEISGRNPVVAPGISPHTLYTVGQELLRSLAERSAGKGLPVCLHLAESRAEMEFLGEGAGEIAAKLYPAVGKDVSWFHGIGRPLPVYLAEAGLLREGLLLVHNVHLSRREIDALHAGGARFVLCPRSNAAHGNGSPDVTHFVDAKIPFALGTDSPGSVPDLSPWSEMRAARSLYMGGRKDTALCREIFRSATVHGAAALDLACGVLAPGLPGDIAVVDDPGGGGDRFFRNLIERTEQENVRMTFVAGRLAHGATP